MHTLSALVDAHGVDVLDHLDRDALVPVHTGLQLQGDVAVVPTTITMTGGTPVPPAGIPVVRGESGGNTHLLLAAGDVRWQPRAAGLALGLLAVPADATAYLAHPEHGYLGVGPGRYEIRRQREQAEQVRLVAD